MRIRRLVPLFGLLLLAQLAAVSCITMPTIVDRTVELVTTGALTQDFHALGNINTYSDAQTIDLGSINLPKVIGDAGIDPSDVTAITLSNVAYRVSVADAASGRQITGKVQVNRTAQPAADLINPFQSGAGAVTGWKPASLSAAGVTQVNMLLAAMLTQLKGGAITDTHLTYTVSGTSTPLDVNSDFHWQLRLTINVQGKVKTKMLSGK